MSDEAVDIVLDNTDAATDIVLDGFTVFAIGDYNLDFSQTHNSQYIALL